MEQDKSIFEELHDHSESHPEGQGWHLVGTESKTISQFQDGKVVEQPRTEESIKEKYIKEAESENQGQKFEVDLVSDGDRYIVYLKKAE